MSQTRICKTCKRELPLTEEFFRAYQQHNGQGGFFKGFFRKCNKCNETPFHLFRDKLDKMEAALPPPPEPPRAVDPCGNRVPVYYGYSRVSSRGQVIEGKSMEHQAERIEKHYAYYAKEKGILWGGVFQDPNVSGFKKLFKFRPAGGVLHYRLLPGDHLAMTSLDRGFRSFKDAIDTIEEWIKKGIVLHLLDTGISTDHHVGLMILRMLAVTAEFHRSIIRENMIQGTRKARREGRLIHQCLDYGWKIVGKRGYWTFQPDFHERRCMKLFAKMRSDGWDDHKIYLHCLEHRVGRKPKGQDWKEWSILMIKNRIKSFQANPFFQQVKYYAAIEVPLPVVTEEVIEEYQARRMSDGHRGSSRFIKDESGNLAVEMPGATATSPHLRASGKDATAVASRGPSSPTAGA